MDQREQEQNTAAEESQRLTQQEEKAQADAQRAVAAARQRPAGGERISQAMRVIDMLDQKLNDAPRVPLRRNLCFVEADVLADLLSQLRGGLPEALTQANEVMRNAQKIVSDAKAAADKTAVQAEDEYKKAVVAAQQYDQEVRAAADQYDQMVRQKAQEQAGAAIADAEKRAEQTIFAAQQEAQRLVEENEITRRAQAYAMETRERAEKDADSIYSQACVHTDKMLSGAASALSRSANELAALRDNLLGQGNGAR